MSQSSGRFQNSSCPICIQLPPPMHGRCIRGLIHKNPALGGFGGRFLGPSELPVSLRLPLACQIPHRFCLRPDIISSIQEKAPFLLFGGLHHFSSKGISKRKAQLERRSPSGKGEVFSIVTPRDEQLQENRHMHSKSGRCTKTAKEGRRGKEEGNEEAREGKKQIKAGD